LASKCGTIHLPTTRQRRHGSGCPEAYYMQSKMDGDDSSEEKKQRLSDRAVSILLAISVVALGLWWTRHLWLSWAGLSRG
jgi:hypothetical protein